MEIKNLISALREKQSRDNRELLDAAADMLELLSARCNVLEKRSELDFARAIHGRDAIDVALYKGEWISTAERVPLRTGEYIVVIEGFSVATALYYDAAMRVWIDRLDEEPAYYRVSFWMEMPEVPGEAKKQKEKRGKCYGKDS